MFIVLLKFSVNHSKAKDFMAAHKAWVKRGFDEGVFLLSGSIQPRVGGAVLAHNLTQAELAHRVSLDPFVAERVVEAEIIEISPAQAEGRLSFLLSA